MWKPTSAEASAQDNGRDVDRLTGEREATVLSVGVLELQEIKRALDRGIRLGRDSEVYLRD